jgi:hypothetical protein
MRAVYPTTMARMDEIFSAKNYEERRFSWLRRNTYSYCVTASSWSDVEWININNAFYVSYPYIGLLWSIFYYLFIKVYLAASIYKFSACWIN